MEKNFWAIEIHTGKMQKFATVSSQICIMRYVQRNLLLILSFAFDPFVAHAFGKTYKKAADPCRYYTIDLIFHARYIKVQKNPKIYQFKVT